MTSHELLALAAAGYAGWWFLSRWLWPYTPCGLCGGGRRNAGSNRRRYGRCPLCKGSGERLRFGARVVHRALRRKL